MKVRKCDRCGAIYEKNTIQRDGDIIGGVVTYTRLSDDYERWGPDQFDLCDKCVKEFYLFMKEPALASIVNGEG